VEGEEILAVITTDRNKVMTGGAPIFLADNAEEQQKISLYLAKILKGMVHDMENGVYIIVRH